MSETSTGRDGKGRFAVGHIVIESEKSIAARFRPGNKPHPAVIEYARSRTGPKNNRWSGGPFFFNCEICGSKFQRDNRRGGKFCSMACYHTAQRSGQYAKSVRSGPSHPNWSGAGEKALAMKMARKLAREAIEASPTKTCKGCHIDMPKTAFYHRNGRPGARCKRCDNERSRTWQASNPELNKRIKRSVWLKKNYGIDIEKFEQMISEQGGVCAICGRLPNHAKGFAVDHDHSTGKLRGILCGHCNGGLGLFKDDVASLRSAADYIEKWKASG